MDIFKKVRHFNESVENGLTEVDAIVINPEGTIEDTIDDTTTAISDIGTQVIVDNNSDLSNAVDAVLENPEASETIQEGVMSNLWERVKNFFEKIIAFVKGIIQKIKVKLGMLSKDATKFLASYKEAISIARKEGKVADYKIEFEFYKGLIKEESYGMDNKLLLVTKAIAEMSPAEIISEAEKGAFDGDDNEDIDDTVKEIKDDFEDALKEQTEKTKEELDSTKVALCVKFIESFNKDMSKAEKGYKDIVNGLNKCQKNLENELKKYERGREKSSKNLEGDDLTSHNENTDKVVKGVNSVIYGIKEFVKTWNMIKSKTISLGNMFKSNAMAALRKHVSGWKKK